ncbi:MAG: replication-associated recombination protein A [Proteobacteria bacterium]|nr:replication-associated recombination protein A [Pseudomonadota bacterium]
MDLFESVSAPVSEPLAHRLRPRTLAEWIGHERVLGERGLVRSWLKSGRFPSILLWGPPGVGKTTLAILIAEELKDAFIQLSAVSSGVKDIKEAAERARGFQRLGRKTVLFFDEIHRLNKSQQDSLLPHVESGIFTLIGATTENPSFEVNAALLSRMRVVRLERMREQDLARVLDRALAHEAGFQGKVRFMDEARALLIEQSEGDARRLLTLLDSIVALGRDEAPGSNLSVARDAAMTDDSLLFDADTTRALLKQLGDRVIPYDKASDHHYQTISAFIKSMRASNPDAAVYYLARMLEGGEDPMFIARRMIIFASEDVGNADPRALLVAVAAKDALETVGLPEARINLAQAAISLALARKDRGVYSAIEAAIEEVRATGAVPVKLGELPEGLKNRKFWG